MMQAIPSNQQYLPVDALRPRNHFRAPSDTEVNSSGGPPTPDHSLGIPFYQQRKPMVQHHHPEPWADPYGQAHQARIPDGGPDERQIENLRTMLANIAPGGTSHSSSFLDWFLARRWIG